MALLELGFQPRTASLPPPVSALDHVRLNELHEVTGSVSFSVNSGYCCED